MIKMIIFKINKKVLITYYYYYYYDKIYIKYLILDDNIGNLEL
jgi:hypothetical protein